jgi:hypothetical protein
MGEALQIGAQTVAPGERKWIEVPVARLPTDTWLSLPVEVVNGSRRGTRLWLSGAVHGDELNGVEIIRRVLARLDPRRLHGAVIAVPVVNVFGFIDQSRYLPDRRDLNRCFPGSPGGSLAARLAHLLMTEVVSLCRYGIDLHTGSSHRPNLPQIRANLKDSETRRLAEAFQARAIVQSEERDGSLRQAASSQGIPVLLYEAGEALRFDSEAIKVGVGGVLRVMAALGMRSPSSKKKTYRTPVEIERTSWVRARRSGILRLQVELGDRVKKKQALGTIADAFGRDQAPVTAPFGGVVLGHTNNPLVNQGDGILNLGKEGKQLS